MPFNVSCRECRAVRDKGFKIEIIKTGYRYSDTRNNIRRKFRLLAFHSKIFVSAGSRYARERLAVLQFFHDHFDGFVKLLVYTLLLEDRVVIDHYVGIDAVVLDNPLAGLGVEVGEERDTHVRAVHVGERATDAYDASPCAGSYHLSKTGCFEAPWE